MTENPSPNWETPKEIAEASARITLDIYELEVALARVLVDPATLKNYLDFCGALRAAKLLFFQNDRQEPGIYDAGAREMLKLARHFVGMIEAASHDPAITPELAKIRKGVEEIHIREIQERLDAPVDERVDVDRKRFGPGWEPIRIVRWNEPVAAAS